MRNADEKVIADFGREWQHFDQSELSEDAARQTFEEYFSIFPWSSLPSTAHGFDLGCGSGRWARFVAPRVGHLYCIEPSEALEVARRTLASAGNISFCQNAVDAIPLADSSMDFGYSLGVLHHVPDTLAGLSAWVSKLKPGSPFLLYLYYSFDNRPRWFRVLWRILTLLDGLFRTYLF
jgi:SAM-dependent methyltransferase